MTAFSVVIPVHDRAGLVADCLAAFIGPEAGGIEVIVVDDGSRDATAETVRAIAATSRGAEIRLVQQANAGPGPARNRGAEAARHDWVVFHDSDDMWLPWTIETLRTAFAGPAADLRVLFLDCRTFTDPAEPAGWTRAPFALRRHATLLDLRIDDRLPTIASSNVAMRRADFLALGGFTDLVRHSEDSDLFYRAGDLGPAGTIPSPVCIAYRKHDAGQLTDAGDAIRRRRMLFLLTRNREGYYTGPAHRRTEALARTLAYTIRGYFAKGHVGAAYTVYRQGAGTLRAAGRWNDLLRLPLTPLLHLLRPQSYPFRWPRRRSSNG